MVLSSFPVDLFYEITALLDPQSILNLRLVSRTVHDLVTPVALRDVRVFLDERNGDGFKQSMSLLKTCADPLPNVYLHAKHFRFYMDALYLTRYKSKDLLPNLWKTIAMLRSVTSFTLEWQGRYDMTGKKFKDMPIYIGQAVDSVFEATGGRLERLTVAPVTGEDWFPRSMLTFRGLKSVKIVRSKCISFNPNPPPVYVEDACSCAQLPFKDIFGTLFTTNPDIEEWEILNGCKLPHYKPDLVLPPTLTKLTSLTLRGINFPYGGVPTKPIIQIDPTPLRNLRHLTVTPTTSVPLQIDLLWDAMRRTRTSLETLVTTQVSPLSLIQYLASFLSLRSLEIHGLQARPSNTSQEITSLFLTQVLPRHAETLENLHITFDVGVTPSNMGGWVFDLVQWPQSLSQLRKLRKLAIHPPPDHEGVASWYSSDKSLMQSYQCVINCVEELPMLEVLCLEWVEKKFSAFDATSQVALARASWRDLLARVAPKLVGRTGRPKVLKLFNGRHVLVKRVDQVSGMDSEKWGWERVE